MIITQDDINTIITATPYHERMLFISDQLLSVKTLYTSKHINQALLFSCSNTFLTSILRGGVT